MCRAKRLYSFFGTLEWLVLPSEIERRKNKARRIIRRSISHYKTSASSARAVRKNDRENVWLHTRNDFRAFTKDATPKTLQIQCSERPLAQNVLCLSSGMMLAVSVAQTTISRSCRARFPASLGSLNAAAESQQLGRILALFGGPRAARGCGSLRSPGAPRFARPEHLASLGQAELRRWLSSAGSSA